MLVKFRQSRVAQYQVKIPIGAEKGGPVIMNSVQKIDIKRPQLAAFIRIQRGVSLVVMLALFAALPSYAQSYYAGTSVGSNGTVYGWAVTDVRGYYMYHRATANATLTSPVKHRQAYASNSAQDTTRADVSLPFDFADTGTYTLSTWHTGYCYMCWCNVLDTGCGSVITFAVNCGGNVTRGSMATCVLYGFGGPTTFNWSFKDGVTGAVTVTSSSGSNSWSGVPVRPGTVSVTWSGLNGSLSAPLLVIARTSGWAFTAVTAQKVLPAQGTGGCASILPPLTTPPEQYRHLAKSCLYQAWPPPGVGTVPSGPNQGYKYTTSISNSGTLYQWHMNRDLEETQSIFYQKQTGTNGCILGSNLATQTQRHEVGFPPTYIQSHWNNYRTSQDNSLNNLGVVAEKTVSRPSVTETQHRDAVNTAMNEKGATILAAASAENINEVNFTETGTFLGNVRFAPNYPPCQ